MTIYEIYEQEKLKLEGLAPDEYENEVKKLAKRLGI